MQAIPTLQMDIETEWRGGQRQVELLCRSLVHRGHPVTLLTRPESPLSKRLEGSGVDIIPMKIMAAYDLIAARKVARLIDSVKPAVVGMHASHSHTLGLLAKKFTQFPTRYVVTRRVDFRPGRDFLNRWKYILAPDGFIAISDAIAEILARIGVPRERIHVVHSGVKPTEPPENARESFREEIGVSEETYLVGDIASLVDHKGHRYLIEAVPKIAAQCPKAVFLVVGDGELATALKEQAKSLGLGEDRLRFLGRRDDVPRILGALDLFVMTSHLEGLCTSIIDAQLAGVPVVATRAGGIPELVEHEETGLLAENKNPDSIAAQIVRIAGDPALAGRLAQAAQKRAHDQFTDDAMVEGTIAAYRNILGSHGVLPTIK